MTNSISPQTRVWTYSFISYLFSSYVCFLKLGHIPCTKGIHCHSSNHAYIFLHYAFFSLPGLLPGPLDAIAACFLLIILKVYYFHGPYSLALIPPSPYPVPQIPPPTRLHFNVV
jgi:hypothetical protein